MTANVDKTGRAAAAHVKESTPTSEKNERHIGKKEREKQTCTEEDWKKWYGSSSTSWSWSGWRWHE